MRNTEFRNKKHMTDFDEIFWEQQGQDWNVWLMESKFSKKEQTLPRIILLRKLILKDKRI